MFRIILIFLFSLCACSVTPPNAAFKVVVLGAGGGLDESNLSCYLVAPIKENRFVTLDAGTLLSGIKKADSKGSFADITENRKSETSMTEWLLKEGIKAYLISHAHYDHTSGMIMNSPDDGNKIIIGLDNTIDDLRDNVFNWRSWINFSSEGKNPLNRYDFIRAKPGTEFAIPNTSMRVRAFPLSHSTRGSTAFLLESDGEYLLYFGDTGPDAVEKSSSMKSVWKEVAPIIRKGKLHGMFLEVSYPEDKPDDKLSSHLTPKWLMTEMNSLADAVNPSAPEDALKELNLIVTHIKPSLKNPDNNREIIRAQIDKRNILKLKIHLAEQGERILL